MPMSRRTAHILFASVALAAVSLAGLAGPAAAQWYGSSYPYGYNNPPPPPGYGPRGYYGRPLRPDEIVDRVEDMGFEDVGRPRYDGRSYVVEATGRSGLRVQLVLDAMRGTIVSRVALGRPRRGDTDEADMFDPAPAPRYGALPGRASPGGPSPYDEMPEGGLSARSEPEQAPRREAARPRTPLPAGALPAPADPRLAPEPERSGTPNRSDSAIREEPAARPTAPAPGQVDGMNPDRAKPAARSAARPAAPAAVKESSATPAALPKTAPGAESNRPKPAAALPSEEAANRPRGPVRVIQGVTPLNGGERSLPAPQNQLEIAKPVPPSPN